MYESYALFLLALSYGKVIICYTVTRPVKTGLDYALLLNRSLYSVYVGKENLHSATCIAQPVKY